MIDTTAGQGSPRRRAGLPAGLLAGVVALLVAASVLVAPPADAGTWALTASGGGTVTVGGSTTLTVEYAKRGRPAIAAGLVLERRQGSSWLRVRTVRTGVTGRASTTVRPSSSTTYRFAVGRAVSAELPVLVVPAGFEVSGSGSGHGVGMSQWGAYQQARLGRTAEQILGYYYQGATAATANDPRTTIDVQVLGPPTDNRTTTVLAIDSGAWRLRDATGSVVATGGPHQEVTVSAASGGVTALVTQDGRTRVGVGAVSRLVFEWTGTRYYAPDREPAVATVDGAQGTYRHGRLVVTSRSARPNVVNQVVLNTEYLYGLDEMPSAWGTQSGGGSAALEAQAVVARSYAIVEKLRGLEEDCACHVYDDTRSQHYTGWTKQGGELGSIWAAAVDATVHDDAGTVTVLRGADGTIAETPYFASSGTAGAAGGTASNDEAFGTGSLPHLRHVADPYSLAAPGNPAAGWSEPLSQEQAQAVFGLDSVASITVTSRWPSGQVRTLTATSATGVTVVRSRTADAWRTSLGVPASWVEGFTPSGG
ncbi:hypothetical protein LEP48_11010 [Isoptericola sp. NEAU-Y5]|uniref:Sporulation stage II protein D amidase enhancer LytB N-terminal domain-containing protein n=1 Tax=Isoptericola luteus TaxID=2879484 RepID=A0ABS7ZHE9_9MICO|nr:SpoIID/LytB domain-containing protein [Isoptericola sp. NEAU-Y5]MCA5893877.1 hypothetical protein [Isoptericola sp. NEAU-Y5]